jgi:hypothetical protein
MAQRREWDALSSAYRGRLSRSGITRAEYESGVSLSRARGHGKTPERPLSHGAKVPPKYQRYYNKRFNRPIKMLSTEGEIWLVSVSLAHRRMIGEHWNAVNSYLFSKPMRKAKWWNGSTRTALEFFVGKSAVGSEVQDGGLIDPPQRFTFLTDLDEVAEWVQGDLPDFTEIYGEVAA